MGVNLRPFHQYGTRPVSFPVEHRTLWTSPWSLGGAVVFSVLAWWVLFRLVAGHWAHEDSVRWSILIAALLYAGVRLRWGNRPPPRRLGEIDQAVADLDDLARQQHRVVQRMADTISRLLGREVTITALHNDPQTMLLGGVTYAGADGVPHHWEIRAASTKEMIRR